MLHTIVGDFDRERAVRLLKAYITNISNEKFSFTLSDGNSHELLVDFVKYLLQYFWMAGIITDEEMAHADREYKNKHGRDINATCN